MNSILIIISLLSVCIQTVQPEWIETKTELGFDRKCPEEHYIHPCVCENSFYDYSENDEIFDTFVYCKEIHNAEVMKWAIFGLRGHHVDTLYIEHCRLPDIPSKLFFDIEIKTLRIKHTIILVNEKTFQRLFGSKTEQTFLSDSKFCSTNSSCTKDYYGNFI